MYIIQLSTKQYSPVQIAGYTDEAGALTVRETEFTVFSSRAPKTRPFSRAYIRLLNLWAPDSLGVGYQC